MQKVGEVKCSNFVQNEKMKNSIIKQSKKNHPITSDATEFELEDINLCFMEGIRERIYWSSSFDHNGDNERNPDEHHLTHSKCLELRLSPTKFYESGVQNFLGPNNLKMMRKNNKKLYLIKLKVPKKFFLSIKMQLHHFSNPHWFFYIWDVDRRWFSYFDNVSPCIPI